MMLITRSLLGFFCGTAFVLGGCAAESSTQSAAEQSATESSSPIASEISHEMVAQVPTEPALDIVTTILPITQFTNAVAAGRATVTPLLPTNVSPHDYQASPGDIARLAQADVLVMNGLEMELFLADLVTNAENPSLSIIDSSSDLEAVSFADRPQVDEHDDADNHDDHAEEQAHDEHADDHDDTHDSDELVHDDHDEDEHAHGEFDPHVWLDPQRAMQQVATIRDRLIELDPDGEAIYTDNAAAFLAELAALDAEIETVLAPFANQSFVVFHDFAFYFADRYSLNAEYLVSLPDENPTPEDVRRVMQIVAAAGLTTILTEPQVGSANPFTTVAGDLNVRVSVFDPLETAAAADGLLPAYYLATMRANANAIAAALGAETAFLPAASLALVTH